MPGTLQEDRACVPIDLQGLGAGQEQQYTTAPQSTGASQRSDHTTSGQMTEEIFLTFITLIQLS